MRKSLFFFVLIFSFVVHSQTTTAVVVDWSSAKNNLPFFEGLNYNYNVIDTSLFYSAPLVGFEAVSDSDIQINSVTYAPISAAELGDLNKSKIPTSIYFKTINSQARDLQTSFLYVMPFVKDGFGFKKITSFTYTVSNSSNKILQSGKTAKINAGIVNSVLQSGDWYRFYIQKSGVYKISKSFLQQLGFKTTGNPQDIQIFGNGGKMLSLSNANTDPIDLTETAIQVMGENDGTFNDQDYILFYGEGVDTWNSESQTNLNLYDTKSYYYITNQGVAGKRVQPLSQPAGNSTETITAFDDYRFYEVDLVNIAKLGRQWFGESFEIKNEQEFSFDFPTIDASVPVKISATLASAAFTQTSFKVSANSQEVGMLNYNPINTNSGIEFNVSSLPTSASFTGSAAVKIKFTYSNNSVPGSKGYLDKIGLIAKSNLAGYGKQFRFQYDQGVSSNAIANFVISNAGTVSEVWDVTDKYSAQNIKNTGLSSFSFKAMLGEVRNYIAVDPSDYYSPLKEANSKIPNQNLKGTLLKNTQGQFQDLDYVIVTPKFLVAQAEKLANFHRSYSKLNVKVVTLETIYQEFSSGKQDIAAIRNCIKYIYDNASTSSKKVRYVNLFGDASYDYKNRIQNNTNIVPIYHALRSNSSGEASFASDDFFGLMDANEGNITSFFGGIDIAIGRMPVGDVNQAEEMINKVFEYHDAKSQGSWRNNMVIIADDSDVVSDATLQFKQNNLSDLISAQKPFFNVSKIFMDAYVQEASAGGNRYPKARKELFDSFEKGALVFNYLGHGGEDGLSAERIWEKSDGQNLNNQFKYPLFITITCEFSRFDNPNRPTAGEYTYWNPKGGAIAMITTIRSIGQFSAENFNPLLTSNLLSFGSNTYTTISEALRISKNTNPNSSTNVVFYLGDPALMLAIAKPKIKLTKVNDAPVSGVFDDFKSLAKMKISGEITDENNQLLTNYNGELATSIYDKNVTSSTLNNDNNSPTLQFQKLGEVIFKGNSTVTNGLFEFNFVVPRDIRIPLSNGRMSFFSKKNQLIESQTGYDTTIKVGGINENAIADNNNPKVKLYMNDETFVYGGNTNESPFLYAVLEDENGINTASGIGHDITAVLDGDVANTFKLNDYYQTNLDDFTKGTLRFPFRNLSVGLHTLSFTAWDVYNNPVVGEIQFVVVGNETLTLTNVLNYPNPFVNHTEFWFTHNKPYEPLEVQIQVMTVTGKIVWTKNQIITTEGFLSREITWDGKDDFGDKIGKGVYVYRLTVKSTISNSKSEKIEKIVIL